MMVRIGPRPAWAHWQQHHKEKLENGELEFCEEQKWQQPVTKKWSHCYQLSTRSTRMLKPAFRSSSCCNQTTAQSSRCVNLWKLLAKLSKELSLICNVAENEKLANLYTESLKNQADQLDFRTKCLNLKEELERASNEVLLKEDGHRNAMTLLKQEYEEKIASLEAQVKASLNKEATYGATISQLHQDLAAHKNHMQVLANRLDQIHFEVESKYNTEVQDLKECLAVEQEEKNELQRKIQILEKELLICKAKLVDQQQEMTSNWQVETLKQKIMKLRKENEVLKRKFSHSEEGQTVASK